jgi:uncharacterized membrane protein YdcZ (DUF606 family)
MFYFILAFVAGMALTIQVGVNGFPQHPISTLRILGAIMLFGGVLLIVR